MIHIDEATIEQLLPLRLRPEVYDTSPPIPEAVFRRILGAILYEVPFSMASLRRKLDISEKYVRRAVPLLVDEWLVREITGCSPHSRGVKAIRMFVLSEHRDEVPLYQTPGFDAGPLIHALNGYTGRIAA